MALRPRTTSISPAQSVRRAEHTQRGEVAENGTVVMVAEINTAERSMKLSNTYHAVMPEEVALPNVSEIIFAQNAVPLDVRAGMGRREGGTHKDIAQLDEGVQVAICRRPGIQDEVRDAFVSIPQWGESVGSNACEGHVLLGYSYTEIHHALHGREVETFQLQLDI